MTKEINPRGHTLDINQIGSNEKDCLNHIRYFERQFPTIASNIDKLTKLAAGLKASVM